MKNKIRNQRSSAPVPLPPAPSWPALFLEASFVSIKFSGIPD
jgi:hypothetical protein